MTIYDSTGMEVTQEAYDALVRSIGRLAAGCPVHGECPYCKAQRFAGDPRESVSLTYSSVGKSDAPAD